MKGKMLVTGAAGFVGGHIVDQLVDRGIPVRAMVRNIGKAARLQLQGVEIIEGDLRDRKSIDESVKGIYGVFHCAALFREAKLPDDVYFDVNAEGTRRLFEASVSAGVRRIIHCSTSGVLGDVKNPPADETFSYAPCDVYQESKVEAEKIALEFYRSGKISGVSIRPGMIYGPRDTRLLKIFRMVNRGRFFYVGKGDCLCHFTDVRDLARAFLLAMEREDLNAQIYFIAGNGHLRLNDAVNKIADMLQVKRPWLHIPLWLMQLLGDVCEKVCKPFGIEPPLYRRRVDFFIKNRSFNTNKAERELGFQPARTFEEELRETIAWYRANNCL